MQLLLRENNLLARDIYIYRVGYILVPVAVHCLAQISFMNIVISTEYKSESEYNLA